MVSSKFSKQQQQENNSAMQEREKTKNFHKRKINQKEI
jgi:hypothetical protein